MSDATDSTIDPSKSGDAVHSIPNVDPLAEAQAQPRVLARQIPPSTARGQMQLGASNIFTDSANQRIMVQDSNKVNVVSLGNIGASMGVTQWGLKVAKAGFDVTRATDTQLVFNSSQDVFKIVKSGTASLTKPNPASGGATYLTTIPHGLGFTPLSVVSIEAGENLGFTAITYFTLPFNSVSYAGGALSINDAFAASTDSSNLYIEVITNGNNVITGTFDFKYYLLQETAV